MRKLSDIYLKLLEAFIVFKSSSICIEIQWLINAKKITNEEFDLLVKDFSQFKPENAVKGDLWFNSREERITFLRERIDNLKNEGL